MSTIFCDNKNCIYQKDGTCNLDSINTQKMPKNPSNCVYFSSLSEYKIKST